MIRARFGTRNTRRLGIAVICMLAASLACSTVDKRIAKNQEAFDRYSAEDQASIREGKVKPGFDEEMVRITLGTPDEVSTSVDESGETVTWGYTKSRPGIGIGFGGGSYRYGGAGGGAGASIGTGPRTDYTALVEFREGRVTSVRYFSN